MLCSGNPILGDGSSTLAEPSMVGICASSISLLSPERVADWLHLVPVKQSRS
jgi:hypothetical protein